MKQFKYVIVGGGVVAGYAAQEFIEHDQYQPGELAIIAKDDVIPYERPPLSKDFLSKNTSTKQIHINSPSFYRQHGITLLLYTTVHDINTQNKTLYTDHNDVFQYDKLLLATGSSAIQLDIEGNDNPLIHYLRTVDDAKSIRQQLNHTQDITIIGGGYIGMEVAASLTQDGHNVTMIFPEDRIMEQFFTPQLSEYFEDVYSTHGIEFIKNVTAKSFNPISDQQINVGLSDGESITSDLVVVGIGANPNLQLIADTDIETDDGIVVDGHLQTSIPDIYAAGDIANYYDPIFNKRRRIEHWQNAVDMSRYATREMLGIEQSDFKSLRYFFSDVFDLSYEFWGDAANADDVVHIGEIDDESIAVWWLKDNHVIASFLMNRSDEERENAQTWIQEKTEVTPETLKTEYATLAHS